MQSNGCQVELGPQSSWNGPRQLVLKDADVCKFTKIVNFSGNWTSELIDIQSKFNQLVQVANFSWNGTNEVVLINLNVLKFVQKANFSRN
jgi:hypothetical protein